MSLSVTDLQAKTSSNKSLTPKKYSNISVDTNSSSSVGRVRVDDETDIEKIYVLGEVLGKGAFGVVREVTHKDTKERFAMKTVNKDKPGSISIQLLEREVEVLKRVNHPSIIQLEAVYETAKKMYMIMELCMGGELSEELKKRKYFKEEDAKPIMRRIVEAVVYLHDNDIVHRDLKLENVLLSVSDPQDLAVKVTDFGLACMKGLQEHDLMDSKCGTPYYMAPEVLNTKHEYTKMCDVWSLGVIMYSLMCGRFPFQSNVASKLEELVQEGKLTFYEIEWINVSQAAKDLLQKMLCVDTTHRYTARRILDDPWFTGEAAKRGRNALDLMRDMDSENEPTSIIISSPSDAGLAPSQSSSMLVPTSVSAPTSTHTPHPSKISGSHSHSAALHSSSHNKHQANQPSPTKKFSVVHGSNHHKALKTRAQSYSVLSASSSGGTSGSTGTSGTSGSTSSGSSFGGSSSTSKSHNALASSPGAASLTSPTHKHSNSLSRQRAFTVTATSKSQVISSNTGPVSPTRKSLSAGSAENLTSNPKSDRKVGSPTRTHAPRTKNNHNS